MFKKLRVSEFVFYIISLIIFLAGLAIVILGIVASYWREPGMSGSNTILQEEAKWIELVGTSILNFRGMGFILIALAALIAIITLVVNADYFERQKDKEARKQLRKQKMDEMLAVDKSVSQKE